MEQETWKPVKIILTIVALGLVAFQMISSQVLLMSTVPYLSVHIALCFLITIISGMTVSRSKGFTIWALFLTVLILFCFAYILLNWEEIQDWHCIEFHIKLSSSWEADDGVIELWFDGIKQTGAFNHHAIAYANNPGGVENPNAWNNYAPTPKLGTGINYIVLHDNANSYLDWSEQAYVYIDDVVISTEPIGPSD